MSRTHRAPILIPPAGFARYDEDGIDLTSGSFPLGRPRVVDPCRSQPARHQRCARLPPPARADGRDGVRYDIVWDAIDASDNSARANSESPGDFVQTITLKRPGTNTPPTATAASASTQSAEAVDIVLRGVDTDMIDGRVDPLEFKIEAAPDNGEFEAPLYPYFIEDFRLTPVGETRGR